MKLFMSQQLEVFTRVFKGGLKFACDFVFEMDLCFHTAVPTRLENIDVM